MKEFNQIAFGGYDIGTFAGYFLWAAIGAYIIIQFNAGNRDVKSDRTPEKFSWGFWFRDNVRRVIFNIACILTAIRFSKDITGHEINAFWSLVIGLSFDLIALMLNKFRLIKLIGTAALTTGEKVDDKLAQPGDVKIKIEKKEDGI